MTERSNTAVDTAEAILKLLEDNEIKPSDGLTDKTDNYHRAVLIVKIYAASLAEAETNSNPVMRPDAGAQEQATNPAGRVRHLGLPLTLSGPKGTHGHRDPPGVEMPASATYSDMAEWYRKSAR